MIKFKHYLILLITIIILTSTLSSCRKWFDDGPHYSLRSIKQRLEGKWEFVDVSVDGVDSTEVFREKIGCYINFSNNVGLNGWTTSTITDINSNEYNCFWSYDKNKSNSGVYLSLIFLPNPFPGGYSFGPFGADHSMFRIERLTKDELWMDVNGAFWPPNTSMYYYIKLNKIK